MQVDQPEWVKEYAHLNLTPSEIRQLERMFPGERRSVLDRLDWEFRQKPKNRKKLGLDSAL